MREAGNTDYGRDFYRPEQSVERIDKGIIGDASRLPTSYTSPKWADWYHDNALNGISDLCGNLWEWQAGMQLVAGEIQIIVNNGAALSGTPVGDNWQAIDFYNGELVPLRSPQSAKFDSPISQRNGNTGTPILSTQINHYNGKPDDDGYPTGLMDGFFDDISVRNSRKLPDLFKILGIYAHENRSDGN